MFETCAGVCLSVRVPKDEVPCARYMAFPKEFSESYLISGLISEKIL